MVAAPIEGRDEELTLLRSCLRQASSGRLSLAVVEGEAGIGKSRLLDELAGVGTRAAMDVRRGAGEPLEAAGPFGPLRAALELRRSRRGAGESPGRSTTAASSCWSGSGRSWRSGPAVPRYS